MASFHLEHYTSHEVPYDEWGINIVSACCRECGMTDMKPELVKRMERKLEISKEALEKISIVNQNGVSLYTEDRVQSSFDLSKQALGKLNSPSNA